MNNSALFTQAHSIARDTVATVGNYQIAFTLALRSLYKQAKSHVSLYKETSQTIALGLVLIALVSLMAAFKFDTNTALTFCAKVSLSFVVVYSMLMGIIESMVNVIVKDILVNQ